MNHSLIIFLVGLSLSMDAFSLSLCYGTLNISKKKTIVLSTLVGVFHFFMPLLGNAIGNQLIPNIFIGEKYIILIILVLIGLDMILSSIKEKELNLLTSILGLLFFAVSVSIDSFSAGIGLEILTKNIIGSALLFSILSSLFTYFGIKIGKQISEKYGKIASLIGGLLLIYIGIHFCMY